MEWLILFSPLIACVIITLITLRSPLASRLTAIGALLVSLALSLGVAYHAVTQAHWQPYEISFKWIEIWSLNIEFGLIFDRLSILMLLIVTFIGSCIFVYSVGYMHDDPGHSRYFAYLSLFMFSMLGIVLSNNFIQIFIFWELVGASSYLLIGFWFEKDSAADAGNKAFLVNRVGDFGFMLGILMCWVMCSTGAAERTFNFLKLEAALPRVIESGFASPGVLALIGLLIFCGVLGKSAQFPLHVWLPDAMEGPTPVSALIHAATMVAAGIYMVARTFFLFESSPEAMSVVAHIGAFTGIFAASIALVQNDIKRILAYSTLSQLGLMVMTLGLGSKEVGLFHLATHAFFKALLFLGAGSVIHALHTQNIWDMGKLMKKLPITSITFLIGSLALCGVFPLSGFWSKDEILLTALNKNAFLYVIASVASGMTSFYMARAFFVAFMGPSRAHYHHEPHESPLVMTGPMMLLTAGAIFAGFFGIPEFLSGHHSEGHHINMQVAAISQIVSVLGISLAWLLYIPNGAWGAKMLKQKFGFIHTILEKKYYMDELYDWIVQNIQQRIAVLCSLFDRYVIIKFFVNGTARVTRGAGEVLRFCQTGRIQTYALILFSGLTIILFVWVLQK